MKTTIKQIIATAIIVATAYALMCGLINILARTIDTPATLIVLSLFVVALITLLALYILARVLINLRPGTPSHSREIIYTDRELAHRDRILNQTLTSDDYIERNSKNLTRKFGPLGKLKQSPKDY